MDGLKQLEVSHPPPVRSVPEREPLGSVSVLDSYLAEFMNCVLFKEPRKPPGVALAMAEADLSQVCGSSAMRALREWLLLSAAARATRRGEAVEAHAVEVARAVLDDVRERRKAAHAGLVAALREGAEAELLQPTKLAVDSLHYCLDEASEMVDKGLKRVRNATQKAQDAIGAGVRKREQTGLGVPVAGVAAAAAAVPTEGGNEKKRRLSTMEEGALGASAGAATSQPKQLPTPRVLDSLILPVIERAIAFTAEASATLDILSDHAKKLRKQLSDKEWGRESSERARALARVLELEQRRLAEFGVASLPFPLPGLSTPDVAITRWGRSPGETFWAGEGSLNGEPEGGRRRYPAMGMLRELGEDVGGVAAGILAGIPAASVVTGVAVVAATQSVAHAEGPRASSGATKRPRTGEFVRGGASSHPAQTTASDRCPSLFVAAAVARANLAEAWNEICQAAKKVIAAKPVILKLPDVRKPQLFL